jgi:hypothetical protein
LPDKHCWIARRWIVRLSGRRLFSDISGKRWFQSRSRTRPWCT